MAKRFTIAVILLLIIFGGTFGWNAMRSYLIGQFFKNYQAPPVYVSTTKVVAKTWIPHLSAVGSLVAVNGVDVSPEVSGQVEKIFFKSGENVKEGMLLVQLDDSTDQQNLNRDLAALKLNKLTYERQLKLYKTNAAARSAVDQAQAAMLQSEALVNTDRVMIEKKKIRAPFTGKIGIRQVNIGQYITAGTAIANLQALQPLFVDFTLPEQDLPKLHKNQLVEITTEAFPNEIFKGQIVALNSSVNVDTRSIQVRAEIPNKNLRLYPGIYANVSVLEPVRQNVITVPQTAIAYSLYGDSVYVVEQKGKDKDGKPKLIAIQKFVRVGLRKGTDAEITQGLNVGATIVTAGQIKLHPNAVVKINNSVSLK